MYDPDLILNSHTRPGVLAFLRSRGFAPAALAIMSNIDLANAYHAAGEQSSTDAQQVAAAAVIATLQALAFSGFDQATIRRIIREEIAQLPPERLEVITPQGSVILDGPLHYRTPLVVKIAAIGHPVMLVGPAGCGKTTIGEHVATALSLPFYITNTITDTHELIGFIDGHGSYHSTPFRQAFECGGVWIADEIDAWEAGALFAMALYLKQGQGSSDLAIFATSSKKIPIPAGSSVLKGMRVLDPNNGVGHGTNIWGSVKTEYNGSHDRVVIFTDTQSNIAHATARTLGNIPFIHCYEVTC